MKRKIVLITGGAKGIGKEFSLKFAKEGYITIINYNTSKIEATSLVKTIEKDGGHAIAIQANVSDYDSVKTMVYKVLDTYGHIDVLINNAGIKSDQILVMMQKEEWDKVLKVNLNGVFNCSKLVGLDMMKKKSGKIINISSVGAFLGTPGQSNYVASKGAIVSMSKTMAREMAGFNVLVNVVAPGFIDTDMIKNDKDRINEYMKLIPQGRLGKSSEVAELVFFIASEKLQYTTGHVFFVDGGLSM